MIVKCECNKNLRNSLIYIRISNIGVEFVSLKWRPKVGGKGIVARRYCRPFNNNNTDRGHKTELHFIREELSSQGYYSLEIRVERKLIGDQ